MARVAGCGRAADRRLNDVGIDTTLLWLGVALWRYPVKSMMGEELNASEVTEGGLLGDRAYALVDSSDGKVASAKNPRKWPSLFDFRAALADVPRTGMTMPPVRITLPDGTVLSSEQPDIHQILSTALKRPVALDIAARVHQAGAAFSGPEARAATAEEYWPDMEGLEHRDTVTDFGLPQGTFFDAAVVHVLTTATLDGLRVRYPEGRFEIRRFRPNIVIEAANSGTSFMENAWIGRTIAIGDAVRLSVTGPCLRDDNARSGRSSAAQPRQRWRLCVGFAGRRDPPR